MSNDSLQLLYVVGGLFLIALAVLWFLLPFAIFGIKDKLTALIAETEITNIQLTKLRSEIVTQKSGDTNNNDANGSDAKQSNTTSSKVVSKKDSVPETPFPIK